VAALRARIGRRICPEIKKAFQFMVSRIERDLVARYDAETGGHFGPHRDDTGLLVAHRRFAVSINLNDDFDGGEISFPEFSPQGIKAPPGTAVVFSASLLHQVSRVTRGRRYVFLTFLFDEEAERLRLTNLKAAREAQPKAQAAAPALA
jgi:predicted 2-oxoglutarate/Fe(II)-dependent dioxygenase YbiX